MFTVFTIHGVPDHIYFVNTDDLGKILLDRDLDGSMIMSQELSLEQLIRLKDRDYKVFDLCLR